MVGNAFVHRIDSKMTNVKKAPLYMDTTIIRLFDCFGSVSFDYYYYDCFTFVSVNINFTLHDIRDDRFLFWFFFIIFQNANDLWVYVVINES